MTKRMWEELEEYLWDRYALNEEFNSLALAEDWGITGARASAYITAYLKAQRNPKIGTLFVMHRRGRTGNAMWRVGVRAADARNLSRQFVDDAKNRIRRAVELDLRAIGELNPRAVPAAEACLAGIEAGVDLLVAILGDASAREPV